MESEVSRQIWDSLRRSQESAGWESQGNSASRETGLSRPETDRLCPHRPAHGPGGACVRTGSQSESTNRARRRFLGFGRESRLYLSRVVAGTIAHRASQAAGQPDPKETITRADVTLYGGRPAEFRLHVLCLLPALFVMREGFAVAYVSWNTPSLVPFAAKRFRWSWTSRVTVTATSK